MSNDIVKADNTKNVPNKSTDIIEAEYNYTRNNLVEIIESSREVLERTSELVLESEHPRMVEVYSQLIKNLAEVNKSIMEVRERKMKMTGELDEDSSDTPLVNNAIFVGSTGDLLKMVNEKNKKNEKI